MIDNTLKTKKLCFCFQISLNFNVSWKLNGSIQLYRLGKRSCYCFWVLVYHTGLRMECHINDIPIEIEGIDISTSPGLSGESFKATITQESSDENEDSEGEFTWISS